LEIAGDPLIKCRKAADEIAETPFANPRKPLMRIMCGKFSNEKIASGFGADSKNGFSF